uniref:Eukaryotic translation initiation factor 2 subunit beta n=1 Tax=Chenopodium quinoa TaxID=63459 RepID=A0A803MJK0_CHEQI
MKMWNPWLIQWRALTVSDGPDTSFAGLKKKKKKPVDPNMFDDVGEGGEVIDGDIGEDGHGDESDEVQLPQFLGRGLTEIMFTRNLAPLAAKRLLSETLGRWSKRMHRQPDHVMSFLLLELGTSGSLDGQQRLVVKGRFAPKNFEGILRTYANEYVICSGCKSSDTILFKENRLFFLRCEQCGSAQSVAPVTLGFVDLVGRRSA